MIFSSLFLHYGPGGNSDVESVLLKSRWPQTNFWNQPRVKEKPNPYQELVKSCAEQAHALGVTKLIGHSFGCDLMASIFTHHEAELPRLKSEESILISPLRSIPIAMINLGNTLNKKMPVAELAAALSLAEPYKGNPPAEVFWNLIMQIAPHPLYMASFWVNQQSKCDYDGVANQGPGFDATEWQVVMNDYLFARQQADMQVFKNKKVKALFGEQDPYYNADDFNYWRSLLGQEQVIILKNCGHYPHLEKTEEILKVIGPR